MGKEQMSMVTEIVKSIIDKEDVKFGYYNGYIAFTVPNRDDGKEKLLFLDELIGDVKEIVERKF